MSSSTPIIDPSQVGGAVGAVGDDPYGINWINTTGPTGPILSTTGNIYGAQFTGASTWNSSVNHTTIQTYDPNTLPKDVVLQRPGKPPLPLGSTIDAIMERLCIIIPAMDKLEKYPALKEAYENYKLIEALIQNDEDNK